MSITGLALAALLAATATGAFVQAATGFGFAIVAAPVFLAVLGSKSAVGLLVALHVLQSLMLVPRVATAVPLGRLGLLLAGAAVGAPLGLVALGALDLRHLKLAAGVVTLTAAGLMMWRRRRAAGAGMADAIAARAGALETVIAGAVAGALTALLVMPGPPMMLHLMRRPLTAALSRALSLKFFAACYVAVLAMSLWAGTVEAIGWEAAAGLGLAVIGGTLGGSAAGRRLDARQYALALDALLVAAGLGAMLSAW